MKHYLILKTGALGDLSFLAPAIDHIHQQDPEAHITWIVHPSYQECLKTFFPKIQTIIPFAPRKHPLLGLEILRLARQLRTRYHQIWIGHRSLFLFVMIRCLTQGRIFQIVRRNSIFLNYFRKEIVIQPRSIHESLAFKKLSETALQCTLSKWIPKKTRPAHPAPYQILVHVGGGSNPQTTFTLKQWPYWEQLLQQLSQDHRLQIQCIGSPEEQQDTTSILQRLPAIQNQVGKTSLVELLKTIQHADFLIGVDSGPLHWADFFQTPCLGIYGPTSPISWGLLHAKTLAHPTPCAPCYQDDGHFPQCSFQHRCMKELTVDTVFQTFQEQFLRSLS